LHHNTFVLSDCSKQAAAATDSICSARLITLRCCAWAALTTSPASAAPATVCLPFLQVTVAEALLTLLQFVLLLVIGWAVDVKVWQRFMPNRVANNASDAIVVSGSCGCPCL
jgi:hypothetical protein